MSDKTTQAEIPWDIRQPALELAIKSNWDYKPGAEMYAARALVFARFLAGQSDEALETAVTKLSGLVEANMAIDVLCRMTSAEHLDEAIARLQAAREKLNASRAKRITA